MKRMIRGACMASVFVTAAILCVPQARAEPPLYDILEYCRQVTNAVGGSQQIAEVCFSQERNAFRALQSRWPHVAPKAAHYCDQVSRAVGGSYQILEVCIDREG